MLFWKHLPPAPQIMKRLGGKWLAGKFLVSLTGDCCCEDLETFLSLVSDFRRVRTCKRTRSVRPWGTGVVPTEGSPML
ncbi:hypothetical protein L3X38_034646 [Prunus dulcis]|uniref:Uncharacterized protein n=1 Tax=Prunus dulcis TaxID=3755 RepID=A0AAD4VJW2_PRUDU|nr:hypothetical protein L3X38_034646 [Prunus dulcis]